MQLKQLNKGFIHFMKDKKRYVVINNLRSLVNKDKLSKKLGRGLFIFLSVTQFVNYGMGEIEERQRK